MNANYLGPCRLKFTFVGSSFWFMDILNQSGFSILSWVCEAIQMYSDKAIVWKSTTLSQCVSVLTAFRTKCFENFWICIQEEKYTTQPVHVAKLIYSFIWIPWYLKLQKFVNVTLDYLQHHSSKWKYTGYSLFGISVTTILKMRVFGLICMVFVQFHRRTIMAFMLICNKTSKLMHIN